FINRRENIVFHGKTGVGKTGLAVGILRQAIIAGYRGRFYNVQDLLDQLYASLADRSTPKLLNALCRYDLLLLDELGYLTLKKEQMNAFFKLMKERYEAGRPTIITTNLQPEQWYSLLEPKDMVDALLDRLNHRCINVHIDGPSLRKTDAG
ncbi:IstB-like ATP-binding protein, partial [delta proteobacterium NaphS2]